MAHRAHRWIPLLLASLIALACSACGSTANQTKKNNDLSGVPVEQLDMDPMLFTADGKGGGKTLDVAEVFKRALKHQKARQFEEAIKHYDAVARYFPDTKYFLPSLYNGGLCYEKLERFEEAAKLYRRIIKDRPKASDTKDAYFRLAAVYEQTKEADKIIDLMTEVLLRNDTNHFDRVEAYVRRGNALLLTKNPVEAEDTFRNAISINQRAGKDRLASNSFYISQALFGMARSFHLQTTAIKLVLPTERMGKDLDNKAKLFLKAQSAYIRALKQHHPQWSVAAGFMIGQLYEDFYVDIFSAEIPSDLSNEHIAVYFEELRKHIRPLMERAIEVYTKNLHFVRRLGVDKSNPWANNTELQLKRLKLYLNDPFTQRRAERLVLKKKNWKTLWTPHFMASDTIDEALEKASRRAKKSKKKSPAKTAEESLKDKVTGEADKNKPES